MAVVDTPNEMPQNWVGSCSPGFFMMVLAAGRMPGYHGRHSISEISRFLYS